MNILKDPEDRKIMIPVYISRESRKAISDIAKKEGMSTSHLIRSMINRKIATTEN